MPLAALARIFALLRLGRRTVAVVSPTGKRNKLQELALELSACRVGYRCVLLLFLWFVASFQNRTLFVIVLRPV